MKVSWVKVGIVAIIVILLFTIGKRTFELSGDIEKIDNEIEK